MPELPRTTRTFKTTLLAAVLAAGALLAYEALGVHAMLASPTSVAVVNMSKLLDALEQDNSDRAVVEELHGKYQQEGRSRMEDFRKRDEEAAAVQDPAKREALLDKINLDKLQFRFWERQAQNEIIIERALRYERLHQAITTTIAELAANEGYDLVIVDEAVAAPQGEEDAQAPEVVQRVQRLDRKRVLYSNPTIDITEHLVRRLNNAFRAKGS